MEDLSQLGIAGVTLGILYVIVRYFIDTITRKDDYIKTIIDEYQKHIEMCNTNFMNHSKMMTDAVSEYNKTLLKLNAKIDTVSPTTVVNVDKK